MSYNVFKVTAILMAGVLFATGCAGVTHTVELGFFHSPPYESEGDGGSDIELGGTVDLAFGANGIETLGGCGSVEYWFWEDTDDGRVHNRVAPAKFCTEWDLLEQ